KSHMVNESRTNSIQLIMPQIGEGVTHVTVKKWLKQPGDSVAKDENILEVFSDKVDILIQSTSAGVLEQQLVKADEELKVRAPYAILNSIEANSKLKDTLIDYSARSHTKEAPINNVEKRNEQVEAVDFITTNTFYSP